MHLIMIAMQQQSRRLTDRLRIAWIGWLPALLLTALVMLGARTLTHPPSQRVPGGVSLPVVRTVTIGHETWDSLTVDEQTSRAFVLNRADATISVLDTHTGGLLRSVHVGGPSYGFLAVSRSTGHVFLSNDVDGTISMLDARTGAVLRTVRDGDNYWVVLDERSNHVFVGHSADTTVTMLDARSGSVLRHLNISGCTGPMVLAMSERTGHLFARCNLGGMAMLDARSGRLLHLDPTAYGAYGFMIVDEQTDRVLSTANDCNTFFFDAQTGVHLRTLTNMSAAYPFAVDERTGRVYVTHGSGLSGCTATTNEVVILDGRTGTVLRRAPMAENPIPITVDSQTGRVLVASAGKLDGSGLPVGPGTLSVLDGATGTVRSTVPVGIDPSDVQVDARARRVLVVNSYSDVNGQGVMTRPGVKGTVMTFSLEGM